MFVKEDWCTDGVTVHPQNVKWCWGHGSVQDTQVFPLQPWQSMSLKIWPSSTNLFPIRISVTYRALG